MEFPVVVRRSQSYVLAAALSLATCHPRSLTVDELIERNSKAAGGRTAIEAVHSIRFDLHIADPEFEVDGNYLAARPGSMRIDIKADGQHVYTEALNGSHGWQWKGKGGPVDESATATAALRHGVELPGHLFGLHEMQARGHRLELAGREKVNGVNFYLLRVILSDGYRTTLYIDPDSWLVTRRRDVRPLHPDINPTPTTIENEMSDFRRVGGVLYPFASVDRDLATGKILERTAVRSITQNPVFDPGVFENL